MTDPDVSSCPHPAPAAAARDTGCGAVSTPRAGVAAAGGRIPLRARWAAWSGRTMIALGLLIPVHVRRGGLRQRLADGLLHRGANRLVRAYRMGAR